MVAHSLSRRAILGIAASTGLVSAAGPIRLLTVTGGHEFDPIFWEILKNGPEWKMEPRA